LELRATEKNKSRRKYLHAAHKYLKDKKHPQVLACRTRVLELEEAKQQRQVLAGKYLPLKWKKSIAPTGSDYGS